MRILFIDDDRAILDGLRRAFHAHRDRLTVETALGAEAGIRAIRAGGPAPEAIVADLRMPGRDGIEVLAVAQEHHPTSFRLLFSGTTELVDASRGAAVAHKVLPKPCSSEALLRVLTELQTLEALAQDPKLRSFALHADRLPVDRGALDALVRELDREQPAMEALLRIVSSDIGIACRVMQLANNPFFGDPRVRSQLPIALAALGGAALRTIPTSLEPWDAPNRGGEGFDAWFRGLQQHSRHVARIAASFFEDPDVAATAFVAGLLHDAGELVLLRGVEAGWLDLFVQARSYGRSLYQLELAGVVDTPHARVGGYLLGLWGLPAELCAAAAHHEDAPELGNREMGVVDAVYIAHCLWSQRYLANQGLPVGPPWVLPAGYLERLGVAHRLPSLEALADVSHPGGAPLR